MQEIYKTLDITENEAKVYEAFLKHENTSAANISRLLHLDKSSCYKAVETLLAKGLLLRAGYNHGIIYKAANPDVLKELYDSKKIQLENQNDMLQNLISKLKDSNTDERSTYISIDKGVEGLMLRMTESLDSKEKLIRENYNHHPILSDIRYVNFIKKYAKERVKRKILLRELSTQTDRKIGIDIYKDIMINLKKYIKEQRTIPLEFTDKNSFRIWDNTAIILSYDDNGEFIVLTIRDKYMVTLLKSLYDFLWIHSIPVR